MLQPAQPKDTIYAEFASMDLNDDENPQPGTSCQPHTSSDVSTASIEEFFPDLVGNPSLSSTTPLNLGVPTTQLL